MPNLKIYVDDSLWRAKEEALTGSLGPIRDLLCAGFNVDAARCQLAIVPVRGLPGQSQANVEIHLMPHPERTRERITEVGEKLRAILKSATGATVSVRVTALDPDTYVALR